MQQQSVLNLQSVLRRKVDILSSNIDEEAILLSIQNSKYYGMNPIATDIWSILSKPVTVKTIIARLKLKYEVDTGQCENDVINFLKILAHKDLVEII